jgi:hypothetical protein
MTFGIVCLEISTPRGIWQEEKAELARKLDAQPSRNSVIVDPEQAAEAGDLQRVIAERQQLVSALEAMLVYVQVPVARRSQPVSSAKCGKRQRMTPVAQGGSHCRRRPPRPPSGHGKERAGSASAAVLHRKGTGEPITPFRHITGRDHR